MRVGRSFRLSARMRDARCLIPATALLVSLLACNLFTPTAGQGGLDAAGQATAAAIYDEAGLSLQEALKTPSEDQRQETLRLLGPPDAFTLQWQELEGQLIRQEEWSYFDFKSRFDFVDGELLWTVDIPAAPDGSTYAHAFDPLTFKPGMSIDEAKALVGDPDLEELPLDEADVPGGMALAGDQILLGFDQGKLVYVQTFILSPEGALATAAGPVAEASPEATAEGSQSGILLSDRFNDAGRTARPMFGHEYMDFAAEGGIGTLSANAPGVLPALYDSPQIADFSASVSMLVPDPKPEAGYGLIFRAQDQGNQLSAYYLLLAVPSEGMLELQQFVNGSVKTILHVPLPASQANVWQLTVNVRGAQLEARANDGVTLRATDLNLLEPGKLALVLSSSSAADSVLFNEIRVEAFHE